MYSRCLRCDKPSTIKVYYKGVERMTKKRFINDINNGQLIDTKRELSTIDYSDRVDFYELWEFLNKLNDENEQLKSTLYYLLNVIQNKCSKDYPKCKEIVRSCFENDSTNSRNDGDVE